MLMKNITPVLTSVLLAGVLLSIQAAMISFQPASQSVAVGSTLNVALTVSGLGSGAAPSLSVFDLDVSYDASVLQFNSFALGDPGLGDQLDLSGSGSISEFDGSVPGLVNLMELSMDPVATLDSLQPGAFILGVFSFTALSPGVSPLGTSVNAFGDSLGDPMAADVPGGNVTVVPEPTVTGLLFAAGSAMWVALLRRHRRV